MCSHCGDRNFPNIDGLRLNRRSFLRSSAAATLSIALPAGVAGFAGSAHAAEATFTGTHGTGFCNSAFFITHARQLAEEDGLTLEFVNTPTFAEQVTFFGSGQVDVSVLPYTSFMALYGAGAPVKIVAGGGIEGCVIVAQPGLDSPEKLKGKTLGAFQLDTLEVLPYDWLKKNGIGYDEITVRYLGSTPEQVEAFKAGAIDIAGVIEPYASALLADVEGAVMLSNGVDIYGPEYTDCVLAVSEEAIAEKPEAVTALIKAMLKGQLIFEQEREAFLEDTVGVYYKTSMENARIGANKQPPKVDQRAQEEFILTRVDSLIEMGYMTEPPAKDAIDWSMLEAAIAASPDVYSQLKYKSA